MEPVSDERFNAAYQRVLDRMERHRTRKTPPNTNHGKRDRQGADPHPSTQGKGRTTEEEEAGCWGCSILLPVARAVLAIIWTVAYCALVKPMCRATKFAFLILAVLGFFALIAAWAINVSLGGLHLLYVWACDDILPNRLFFVDWCDGNIRGCIEIYTYIKYLYLLAETQEVRRALSPVGD
ncbi:hypothetical protein ColTof4_14381 [Colletotrichum tofieldiae]|nr:hypothetical protein ColTof3_14793 [Colletotrichum tofieldiae]GKT81958.1 hypothetical protein ColTof4_14381 [Colletotrichum tofieldiae]